MPSTYFELNSKTIHRILFCDEDFGYSIYTKGPPLQTESEPPIATLLGKDNTIVCIYFLKDTSISVSVIESDLGVTKHLDPVKVTTIDEMLENTELLKSLAMSFMNAYTNKKEFDLADPQSIPDLYKYLHTVCDNHKVTEMIELSDT